MIGVGLRPKYYKRILERATRLDFYEAISENYMDTEGRPRAVLRKVRENYPIALHGVSMSIGSAHGLNRDYLRRLRTLIDEIDPFIVSDHLCFTRDSAHNSHDLLPMPFTREAVRIVCRNINRAQETLGRTIAMENVSTYFTWRANEMTEWDFIREIVKRSGCKILLDINNIFVNAMNHGFDAKVFLDSIESSTVAQIHMAGFTDMGDYLFDTHSKPVHHKVWKLYESVKKQLHRVPKCIERDDNFPAFAILEREALRLR